LDEQAPFRVKKWEELVAMGKRGLVNGEDAHQRQQPGACFDGEQKYALGCRERQDY